MITEIGTPNWTTSDIKNIFDEFVGVYANKPINDNRGGMKAPHAFASYFMLKTMQPRVIIESGVWKGQGTWLFEEACPNSHIISLDIDFSNLIYKSPKVEYIEQDFSYLNLSGLEKDQTLCFFDDHQNAFLRLQQMRWKGLRKAIFEDNYPVSRGDCYSLKKIFSDAGFSPEERNDIKGKIKDFLLRCLSIRSSENILKNTTHSRELFNSLSLYYEFPPLFKESLTRWGDEWREPSYPTKHAIFDNSFHHELRKEALHYNWMCYVELKD